jgi:hypothetical protein
MQTKVDNFTQKVLDNLSLKQEVVFDPMTAMMIGSMVLELIKIIKKCREKPETAVTVAHYPTPQEKRILKRVVRRKLGFFKNWNEGDRYVEAILDSGKTTTTQDFIEAYEEV